MFWVRSLYNSILVFKFNEFRFSLWNLVSIWFWSLKYIVCLIYSQKMFHYHFKDQHQNCIQCQNELVLYKFSSKNDVMVKIVSLVSKSIYNVFKWHYTRLTCRYLESGNKKINNIGKLTYLFSILFSLMTY